MSVLLLKQHNIGANIYCHHAERLKRDNMNALNLNESILNVLMAAGRMEQRAE